MSTLFDEYKSGPYFDEVFAAVLANRQVMTFTFPRLFREMKVQPVDIYPDRLLSALSFAAPQGTDHLAVVLLTPGVYNSAYFEHTFLAKQMGIPLVDRYRCAGPVQSHA